MHKKTSAASVLALAALLAGCAGSADPEREPEPEPTASETSAVAETPEADGTSFPDPEPAEATIGSPFTATTKVGQTEYTQAEITITGVAQISADEQASWPELGAGTAWTVQLTATNLGDDTTIELNSINPFAVLNSAGDQPQASQPHGYYGDIGPAGCAMIPEGAAWAKGDTVEGCMVQVMPAGVAPASVVYFSPTGTDEAGEPTYATVTMPLS